MDTALPFLAEFQNHTLEAIFDPEMRAHWNGIWAWVANSVTFGLYHIYIPWGIPSDNLFSWLMAFTAKRYRYNWFPNVLHNGLAFYFGFLIQGLVLGLA